MMETKTNVITTRRKEIVKPNGNEIYFLYGNEVQDDWIIAASFIKWDVRIRKPLQIEFTIINKVNKKSAHIEDIHYCISDNYLEIHITQLTSTAATRSTKTARNNHLMGMTLKSGDEIRISIVVHEQGEVIEYCKPHFHSRDGNIIVGG